MKLKKFLGVSAFVCGVLLLNVGKVKADQEDEIGYKKDGLKYVNNYIIDEILFMNNDSVLDIFK